MLFSQQPAEGLQPSVLVNGARLDVVEQFECPGVVLNSNLTFKPHVKKVSNIIKFNLSNF